MSKSYAEIAAEMTIAAMQPGAQSSAPCNINRPGEIADFYETIFQKIIEMEEVLSKLQDS